MHITRSTINTKQIASQGRVNGRWVVEAHACPDGFHPAGTLVCDPAPGEPDDLTFTALDGERYWDTPAGSQWTPRDDAA